MDDVTEPPATVSQYVVLNGTTAWEISTVVLPCPLGIFLLCMLLPWIFQESFFQLPRKKIVVMQALLEFPLIVFIMIVNVTILCNMCEGVAALMICAAVGIIVVNISIFQTVIKPQDRSSWKDILELKMPEDHLPYVTNYRGLINMITAICILAVDFRIFPARFAKTELHGYGLMDTGVGCFVLAHGLVSPEARHTTDSTKRPTIRKAISTSIPLLVLGFLRLALTKAVNYHTQVSEYGRHWNFFFTLAITKLISSLILTKLSPRFSLGAALLIMSMHEVFLQQGMSKWILDDYADRSDIITANKEGLGSCLGYVALHFAGVAVGQFIFHKRLQFKHWLKLSLQMSMALVVIWIMTVGCDTYYEKASRRLANVTYCLWMLAFNGTVMAQLLFVDLFLVAANEVKLLQAPYLLAKDSTATLDTKKDETEASAALCRVPVTLDAINYNGLLYFLIANVFTGLVNLSMKTSKVSQLSAVLILTGYMFLTCSIVVGLLRHQIRCKWW